MYQALNNVLLCIHQTSDRSSCSSPSSLIYTYAQGRKGATNGVYNPPSRHDTRFSSQWYNLEIMYTLCIINKFELELRLQSALDNTACTYFVSAGQRKIKQDLTLKLWKRYPQLTSFLVLTDLNSKNIHLLCRAFTSRFQNVLQRKSTILSPSYSCEIWSKGR